MTETPNWIDTTINIDTWQHWQRQLRWQPKLKIEFGVQLMVQSTQHLFLSWSLTALDDEKSARYSRPEKVIGYLSRKAWNSSFSRVPIAVMVPLFYHRWMLVLSCLRSYVGYSTCHCNISTKIKCSYNYSNNPHSNVMRIVGARMVRHSHLSGVTSTVRFPWFSATASNIVIPLSYKIHWDVWRLTTVILSTHSDNDNGCNL